MPILFWSDLLRYVTFGQAFIVVVLTSVIVARYSFKLSLSKARERALPWHIVLIGSSYLGLTLFALFDLRDYVGTPLTWRAPAALFCFATGDAGFVFMLIHLSIQRLIVTAVVDKMSIKLADDLDELKEKTIVAASKAEVAALKAEETNETVCEIKKKLEDGNNNTK